MECLNIEEKIKKSIKFIVKKFNKAVIEVKIVNEESLYIKIDNKGYSIIENYNGKCDGILIIQDGQNNFYEFKNILRDVPKYFSGNGIVFVRYEVDECDSVEYVENQFITYFKLNKFRDIEEYILLSEEGKESGIFITASYHVELLEKEDEYEEYTPNFMRVNKCSGGCESSGGCASCKKGCCKK